MNDYYVAMVAKARGKQVRNLEETFPDLMSADVCWHNVLKIIFSYLKEYSPEDDFEIEAGLFQREDGRCIHTIRKVDSADFIQINGFWYSRGIASITDSEVSRLIKRNDELEQICASAYQVVGVLANEANRFGDDDVDSAMTMLSDTKYDDKVIPFESKSSPEVTTSHTEKYFLGKCLKAIKYDIEENSGREPSCSVSKRNFDEIYNQAKNAKLL